MSATPPYDFIAVCSKCGRLASVSEPDRKGERSVFCPRGCRGFDIDVVPVDGRHARRSALPPRKRCTRCGDTKSIDEFYKNRGRPYSHCKPCWNEYLAERAKEKAA